MYRLATMHRVIDRQTDRQADRRHYQGNSRSYCVQRYDRLKIRERKRLQVKLACRSCAMHGLSQWNSLAKVLRALTKDECHGLGRTAISARCGSKSCVCSNRTED